MPYRGRLAPSPTGYLHLGHMRTFWIAQQRVRAAGGQLVLRVEDLDPDRCKPEFVAALLEDLRWFGFVWDEGPDTGGSSGPYFQSQRGDLYLQALATLRAGGLIYPCKCTRKDLRLAAQAPHPGDDEPIYPGTCRPRSRRDELRESHLLASDSRGQGLAELVPPKFEQMNWRFQVPDGEVISFQDGGFGEQRFEAGRDFGDFLVWRHDGVPAYQLAAVVDDAAMKITEVVRGADLLRSTARQILLYRALGLESPQFFHCSLLTNASGQRLAKRHGSGGLRWARERGQTPEILRQQF